MIYPVILCGGSGTRLWPVSRSTFPKQFVQLYGEGSLFQQSAVRTSAEGFNAPIIITGSQFRFTVADQLQAIGVEPASIMLEPFGRNTAPAVAIASLLVAQSQPDGLLLLTPSDHVIPDDRHFRSAVNAASFTAKSGKIVTFGIRPTRPETGYGYLQIGTEGQGGCRDLTRFVEKPNEAAARDMIAGGDYLWNAGIFLFRADVMLKAFEAYAPDILDAARNALDASKSDLDFIRLGEKEWSELTSTSIDYSIMEKADNLSVMPYDGEWSDLGSWSAVAEQSRDRADDRGNIVSENSYIIESEGSYLKSDDKNVKLVGIGLKDIVAVATGDAVLIASKDKSQKVRGIVDLMKADGVKQATEFKRDYRPWGSFESLAVGKRFQVKSIVVKPGGKLSLQSHKYRAEHWIVVAGTARVTIGDDVKIVTENESVYVPLGAVHRMENPYTQPLRIIEVQTGIYLGEDDIIRYEDVYNRNLEEQS
ncbi:mannose-1-phosphate guanylyltransferase/mannose-6-phosphate isomerase [Roseobacter sp. HKCCD5988]|uniref:mannose-1-phosphate guanylyltransferase/mannose-6-phosphate isomerase n=1 Tax=Roseobacter sp. HKCCD5988 TaxID=3120338 RepID=UPI0030ED49C0